MDAERLFTETKQGFGFYHKNFGVPYAFGKYDQLFVPEFNAGAMENAGAVTFLEDYVFRSARSPGRPTSAAPRPCCTRWRTCGSATWSPWQWWDDLWLNESFATFASVLCQAEATEYNAGVDHVRQRREVVGLPAGPAAVDASRRRRHPRPGTPSRSTSTASPTPRAPACSSSSSPTSGWRSSWPACATTSATTHSATPRSATCSARWRRRRAATCRAGAAVAQDHRAQHAAAGLRPRRRRHVHPLRDHPERRAAGRRRDPGAPPGGRRLRRRRQRQAGAHPPRGARRRGSTHGCSCAAGRFRAAS